MYKNKKRIIGLAISSIVCFSSIYAYAKQKVKKELNTDEKSTTIIDEIEPETKIYDSDEIEEIINDSSIQPYNIEYIAESEAVTGKGFVNQTLELKIRLGLEKKKQKTIFNIVF